MYQPITKTFNNKAPMAEIYRPSNRSSESDYFFQLLSRYGTALNEKQKEGVTATEGPVLLIAGAGSGKTTVLTSRIGYMIHSCNVNPSNILLVTFTKKASLEMVERLSSIPGINRAVSRSVVAGTYHSICFRILRSLGYDFQLILSDYRRYFMIKTILKKMKCGQEYTAEAIFGLISNWKNSLKRPEDIIPHDLISEELKIIYSKYEEMKKSQNLFDFDDMLVETYYLLKSNPDVLKKFQEQFKYILCDEFQDTSFVQYEIIRMLAEPHNNLCIVGDDSQTIYTFRSANSKYMIEFDKYYPNCRRIVMDINYRSSPSIVGLGNAIIRNNKNQIPKTLKVVKTDNVPVYHGQAETSDHEALEIVRDIKSKISAGVNLKDMAVIYRTHATGRAIFDKLLIAEIPFVVHGKSDESFYQNAFVKPILSIMRISINPQDVASIVDAAPIFYIKRTDMEKVVYEIIASNNGVIPRDLFNQAMSHLAEFKKGFQKEQLLSKVNAVRSLANMKPSQAIRSIRLGAIGYEKHLEIDERKSLTIHKEIMLEFLDECEQASLSFSTISGFLFFVERVEEKNKEMEELRKQPNIEAVHLMTIHTSKGLEFDVVYGIGWVEGILPHQSSLPNQKEDRKKEDSLINIIEALEEERRLAYVCVTRAKRYLYLSSVRYHRNKLVGISRFIYEGVTTDI